MKKIEILSIVISVIFMNLFTFLLLKNNDSLLDPKTVIWFTGFFSGAIMVRLLMEILDKSRE